NLGVVGGDAPVILIRDDTGSKSMPSEAEAIAAANRVIARNLDQLGIASVVMSDLDVTGARLRGKKIVILPYNPGMTDSEANELVNYLGAGGKLLAFYQLPAKLADAVGIGGGAHVKQPYAGYFAGIRAAEGGLPGLPPSVNQASWNIRHTVAIPGRSRVVATWWTDKGEPTGEAAIVASANGVFMTHVLLSDDARNKRFLLVSLLDNLNPGVLEQAAATSLAQIGNIGPYRSLDEVARGIGQQPLAQARALQRAAVTAAGAREYRLAMTRAAEAQAAVLRAYCAAQQPKAGEHRAWWCHSAFGVPGMTWDQAIKNLADNGFTAIMVNMLWGGVAYYHSTVLPVAPEVKEQGDQIIACLAACRKYGVQCHVWKVDWNMSQRTPPEFAQRMQREGRTQMGFDGKAEPLWLCPSNPANQQLEIDAMVEVATRYDVDGIHFDYIRYPDDQHCFCPGCRARFEATIGKAVANWPADVLKDPALRQQWLDFRRANITRVVAAVHDAVKKAKPRVQISAAVFPNWPVDHDQVGQDWKLWCERGYLDFVCPMDYTQSTALLTNMVSQQLTYAGKVPCYPGIGLSTWDSEPDVVKLIEQINAVRQAGAGGFTIFNYGVPEADIAVPLCGAGMTRKN
ncbi:MAG TPA: family 10 glycosylhydrolase, partial [Armatimonadota bacterium]